MLDWIQDYGWSIPVFAVGVLCGLALLNGNANWLRTLSSIGTLGAAIAAFCAVYLNSQDQRRRRRLEDQSRQPYLIVTDASFTTINGENGEVKLSFTNLSQHPIHIRDAVVWSDDDEPSVFTVGLLIPASQTVIYNSTYNVHLIQDGGVTFLFNYAPTGPVLNSLALPYVSRHLSTMRKEELKREGLPVYRHTPIKFILEGQAVKTNVEDEAESAREFLAEIYEQPRHYRV
jgi:hypothetical protein